MKLSWKLLPVATLFALGVFMVSLPSGAKPASATPTGVTSVNPPTVSTIGGTATITASYTDDTPTPNASAAVLQTTNPVVGYFLTGAASVTPINGEQVTVAATSVTVTEDADTVPATKTITATFICQTSGTTTFILTHGGIASTTNGTLSCSVGGIGGVPGTGQLSIQSYSTVLANGAQGSYTAYANATITGQTITITANPALVTFQQPNVVINGLIGSQDTMYGQNTNSISIITNQVGNRTITGTFICVSQGTVTLSISMGSAPGVVGVGIGTDVAYTQPIVCGTGLVSPTVGPASSVTVAASPTSVGCNGTAFVTVTVRNTLGGYVADGTSVSLTTSVGSLSPTTATTLGGGVLAVFTAANQSGLANIQASAAGTAQGTASITVNCNAATPVPAVPPTIYIPPQIITGGGSSSSSSNIGIGTIQPPNTGDAGLADNNAWQLYAGIALIVMSGLGAVTVVRARS